MNEPLPTPAPDGDLPHPEEKITRSGPSLVWIIPLVALLIGVWLIAKTYLEKGPVITIHFKTAEGIQAGKTNLLYKNVQIGQVTDVSLDSEARDVVVTASLHQGTENFLRRSTLFWVVRPRLTIQGVSGLGTLVSGSYIEIEPGVGKPQREFTGLETPSIQKMDQPGKKINLITKNIGSLSVGAPILFQGLQAGEVMTYELASDHKSLLIHAFIKAPFDEIVRGNSLFWRVSGVSVTMDAGGFKIQSQSLLSLLMGGISFETPETLEPSLVDDEEMVFTLHESYEQIQQNIYTQKSHFILFFDGSVRGLAIGAPVEFKGIRIGSVTDIRLEFNTDNLSFRVPVLIEIEPERITEIGGKKATAISLDQLIDKGLRAQLTTGSLLTGQLFINMDINPEAPLVLSGEKHVHPELPTIPTTLDEVTDSVTALVARLKKLPVDEIGQELLATLQATNRTLNTPELIGAIQQTKNAMKSLQGLLDNLNTQVEPAGQVLKSGRETLEQLTKTMQVINSVVQPDAPLTHGLVDMAQELTETARAIRILMESLEQNPESLLYGKKGHSP